MTVLLLRLAGPMQSWGTQSRFTTRDTGLEPSKSGVIGLLCAAMGFPRSATEQTVSGRVIRLEELARLEMGVRIDREGTLARDFHTAGGGTLNGRQNGQAYGVVKASGSAGATVVSFRYFLADADFLVAIGGEPSILERLQKAVQQPVWPLFLGRKSFVPGHPVWIPDGLLSDCGDVESALRNYPWKPPIRTNSNSPPVRLVLETHDPGAGEPRADVPISFDSENRRFGVRHVRTAWIDNPDSLSPSKTPTTTMLNLDSGE
jgi:CRISPR system Cascade subunit CasD